VSRFASNVAEDEKFCDWDRISAVTDGCIEVIDGLNPVVKVDVVVGRNERPENARVIIETGDFGCVVCSRDLVVVGKRRMVVNALEASQRLFIS
jgi:hypothetical protein